MSKNKPAFLLILKITAISACIICCSSTCVKVSSHFSLGKCGQSLCLRRENLKLRGGSWNPVKWFEDAVESAVKEDVKDMLHTDKEASTEGRILIHLYLNLLVATLTLLRWSLSVTYILNSRIGCRCKTRGCAGCTTAAKHSCRVCRV